MSDLMKRLLWQTDEDMDGLTIADTMAEAFAVLRDARICAKAIEADYDTREVQQAAQRVLDATEEWGLTETAEYPNKAAAVPSGAGEKPAIEPRWQKCPICAGRGNLSAGFYPDMPANNQPNICVVCRTCEGRGMVRGTT
jgi:hypothetical protein